MDTQIRVSVARRFDNRDEGLADDSPRAIELHRIRAAALHDIFDLARGLTVLDWGDTDDREAHEFVELLMDFVQWATQPQQLQAAGAAALAIGKFLGAAVVGESVKEGVKWLFERLRRKQHNEEITNVNIRVTRMINIQMDPPKFGGRVYVSVQVDGPPFGASVSNRKHG